MSNKPEEIEVLEAALKAAQKKYGYAYLDVSLAPDHAKPYYAQINYPNGRYTYTGNGTTLREALSEASGNALNSGAGEGNAE